MAQATRDSRLKINVIGGGARKIACLIPLCFLAGAVGKTCLLLRMSQNMFPEEYIPTLMDEFEIELPTGKTSTQAIVFDYSSRSDDHPWFKLVTTGAHVVMLCYAVNNSNSLMPINENVRSLRQNVISIQHAPDVPVLLCGLKEDLREDSKTDSKKVVSVSAAEALVKQNRWAGHMLCSALADFGVREMFARAAELGAKYLARGGAQRRNDSGKTHRCSLL